MFLFMAIAWACAKGGVAFLLKSLLCSGQMFPCSIFFAFLEDICSFLRMRTYVKCWWLEDASDLDILDSYVNQVAKSDWLIAANGICSVCKTSCYLSWLNASSTSNKKFALCIGNVAAGTTFRWSIKLHKSIPPCHILHDSVAHFPCFCV